jgi:hypothetical protein
MQPRAHLDLHLVVTKEAVLLTVLPRSPGSEKGKCPMPAFHKLCAAGYFKTLFNVCVLFFQTVTKLLGQIVIKFK